MISTLPRRALETGADLLRLLGQLLQAMALQAGSLGPHLQVHTGDAQGRGIPGAGGGHLELLRSMAGLRQDVGEGHGVADRVGGGEQLLRAGEPLGGLRAAGEGDPHVREGAASDLKGAAARPQISRPGHSGRSLNKGHG